MSFKYSHIQYVKEGLKVNRDGHGVTVKLVER